MKFDVIQMQRLDLRELTPEQYGDILLNCSNQEIMEYLNLEEPEVNIEKEKLKRGFSTHNTLLGTQMPVSEIALQIGFEHQSSFCKAFKRQFLMTPVEYRNCR